MSVFNITLSGIEVGDILLPTNQVYENLEMYSITGMCDNDVLDFTRALSDTNMILVNVGIGGYSVLIKKEDVMHKKTITIYTVPYNVGSVIGTGGSNIANTLRDIQNKVPGCKLKFIKVLAL